MRKYDTTFIIDGTLGVKEREALTEQFSKSLEKHGGKLDRIVRWGQRTLAYTIKKRLQGYYVIFYHTSNPTTIKAFERELTLNENVFRFMTLVFDGKHPEYIRDEGLKRSYTSYSSATAADKLPDEIPAEVEKENNEYYFNNPGAQFV